MMFGEYSRASSVLIVVLSLIISCATGDRSAKAPSSEDKPGLEDVWIDTETKCLHTIVKNETGFAVTSVDNADESQEQDGIDIISSEWKDGTLSWTYFVRQTGYTVTIRTVHLDGDRLEAVWSNDDGKGGTNEGKEILYRKNSVPAPEESSDDGSSE